MEKFLKRTKGARSEAESVTEQAERIWKMLDDLADENPDGYKRFIETNIREGKEMFEPAEPAFCIRTKLLASQEKLYINMCSYSRISKAKEGQSIKTISGDILRGFYYNKERVNCIVVAFHPQILEDVKSHPDDERDLVSMAIRYVQDSEKIGVSFDFVRHHESFVGLRTMLSDIPRIMHGMQPVSKVPNVPDGVPTLEQLSQLAKNGSTGEESITLSTSSGTKSSTPLVTELKITSLPVTYAHRITVRDAQGSKPRRAVFCAALSEVSRVADITVDVSRDDIVLKVPSQPTLCLQWPVAVKDTQAVATFGKSGILTVKAPVAS